MGIKTSDFRMERKAPQKQCKDRDPHASHHYERPDGLINWCQGRGNHLIGGGDEQ